MMGKGLLPALYRAVLLHGLGRTYGRAGPATTDCVRLVAAVLDEVLPERLTPEQRRDILIAHDDPARPWSGIEALVGLGHPEVDTPIPHQVHVCQRWSGLDARGRITPVSRGHAFVYVAGQEGDGLVIEATDRDHQWAWGASWASARLHPPGSQTRLVVLELS